MFEGTPQEQLARQIASLKSQFSSDGTPLYPEGTVITLPYKDENDVIQYEEITL
ncbi:hypothetical protein KNT70_gp040 [Cronobacter phage Pet-CM3-4]|jgi:hypothetical protein|uniref:Uncharacterized protein n=2 Tax=Karamvirus TaxID=1913650 RepID=A0A1D3RKJ5_9CAUD|nr:hypothetical protein KNT70_gp040 [Cronobacter phage Pet-CM3-4]QEG13086.1 hypothetical protein KAALPHA_49 [Klebsiella phage vB_KaeM_KaAlpha]UES35634.1 hypothetical protein KKP3262_000016 [Enterobacter phage KKP_3262]USL86015.1 hypothetical protein [Enterobacter phage fGh-Ecl04]SCN45733.1 hypothetical protein [Cronobacter phage Pet-CM3-4]